MIRSRIFPPCFEVFTEGKKKETAAQSRTLNSQKATKFPSGVGGNPNKVDLTRFSSAPLKRSKVTYGEKKLFSLQTLSSFVCFVRYARFYDVKNAFVCTLLLPFAGHMV